MKKTAILLAGHGSRKMETTIEFEKLALQYQAFHPEYLVFHGFLEIASPSIEESLCKAAEQTDQVIVSPIFLFSGGHVRKDIPKILQEIQQEFPEVQFSLADSLGSHPKMVSLVQKRLGEIAGASLQKQDNSPTAIMIVGRGASDDEANEDFYRLVQHFAQIHPHLEVYKTFIGITEPRVPETLSIIAQKPPQQLLVIPYLLFYGKLIEKLQGQLQEFSAQQPRTKVHLASHLGLDSLLFEVIQERIENQGS